MLPEQVESRKERTEIVGQGTSTADFLSSRAIRWKNEIRQMGGQHGNHFDEEKRGRHLAKSRESLKRVDECITVPRCFGFCVSTARPVFMGLLSLSESFLLLITTYSL